jgi:hypothetical protein
MVQVWKALMKIQKITIISLTRNVSAAKIILRASEMEVIINLAQLAMRLMQLQLKQHRRVPRKMVPRHQTRMYMFPVHKQNKLHGLSPRVNYTDRATAACRPNDFQLLRIEGATWSA